MKLCYSIDTYEVVMKQRKKHFFNTFFIIFFNIIAIILLLYIHRTIEVSNIIFQQFNANEGTYSIEISKTQNFFDFIDSSFECIATNGEEEIRNFSINNSCLLTLPIHQDYEIYLQNHNLYSKKYRLLDYLDNLLTFSFNYSTIYLVIGEESPIEFSAQFIYPEEIDYHFTSSDESIAIIDNNKIKALKAGTTMISSPLTEKKLKVIVTDLITLPTYQKQYKQNLPCHRYNQEEANLLDSFLEYRIHKVGDQTRAAAIEAARFLTLSFPYRIPYFYENGRVHESGINYVDGEGRYYKKGLYLNESKFANIQATFSGPAIWGCPLTNWEPDEEFGYYPGVKKPNGLDCSGFVAWVLINAGFDPGDIGAGETEYPYQMTDLGKYTELTFSLIRSNTIKVGDLVNYWGHIGIIIGIDEDSIYVAESLQNFGGVVARKYSKYSIHQTFDHVVLMDDFYKKEGIYSNMWN